MSSTERPTPLALIGIGCLFPKAESLKAYWSNVKERVDAITEVPPSHWAIENYFDQDPKSPDRTYARRGGFLPAVDFDPTEFGISPNNIPATDPAQLLGLVTAQAALRDAGYGPEKEFDRRKVSVILGVTGALELVVPLGARLGHPIWRRALREAGIAGPLAESVIRKISDSYVEWQENSFPGLLGNVVAGRIANRLDLGGTNCVVDAACASSLGAGHLASLELASGRADLVVTGGVDAFNDIFMYMCFSKTPALSPTGDSRPFDSQGDGTIIGEGVGMIVLKRLADAERDKDRVYAVLKAIGSSSDGRGKAIYAPSPEGQVKALEEAYRLSGVSPATIGLVEAHGTGTKAGDAAEVRALSQVYRGSRPEGTWCALGSVKSNIGHTKAAAGSAGLIKAALALRHKVLPPTIKVGRPLAELEEGRTPFYINTEKRPWLPSPGHPRRAAVSAFGFGGSNFHAVLEEHSPTKAAPDWDGLFELAAFSASSREELKSALSPWLAGSQDRPWPEVQERALESRRAFQPEKPFRLAVALEREKGSSRAFKGLAAALEQNAGAAPTSWETPEGACYGSGAPLGKLAFLFPGQGSQYVGMFGDLACQFPEMHSALAETDAAFGGEKRLSDFLYPHPAFSDEARTQNDSALRSTEVAQSAIGAVSLGAWRLLESFGARAEAAAGHSYGELVALCAAGRLEAAELHALSKLRGRLMASGGGDQGSMLAVQAAVSEVEEIVRKEQLDVVLANKNAPRQVVLSGATNAIQAAAKIIEKRGHRAVFLPVSAAFHSPLVAQAKIPLREALEGMPLAPARIPVYSNTTTAAYPADPAAARDLLAGQLAAPVEFMAEIEAMHKDGVRIFLEVGPGARLTGLVGAILSQRPHAAFALDSSNGRRHGTLDLARCLARLAALGLPVDLNPWEGGGTGTQSVGRKKSRISVKLSGATPVNPKRDLPMEKPSLRQPPSPPPAAPTAPQSLFAQALRSSQEGLASVQKLQEQTALLHKQFLEGQEATQRALQSLIESQQRFFAGALDLDIVLPPSVPPLPMTTPSDGLPAERAFVPGTPSNGLPVSERVQEILLAVVSEKTGYPAETLNLDMGLESDLGIDSIKRVEILSAMREKLPQAPVIGPQHIGALRTLRQIIGFLCQAGASEPRQTETPPLASGLGISQVQEILLAVVSEKTGYPAETLNLDMGLESDLGIDSIKRVEILSAMREKLPQAPVIGPQHIGALRTLRQIIGFLCQASASEPRPTEPAGEEVRPSQPARKCRLDKPWENDPPPNAAWVRPTEPSGEEVRPSVDARKCRIEESLESDPPPNAAWMRPVRQSQSGRLERSVLSCVPLNPDSARPPVPLPPGSILWITEDGSPLALALAEQFRSLGHRPQLISLANAPEITAPENLAGLVILAPASQLVGEQWSPADEDFLRSAFELVQKSAAALKRASENGAALLALVSRLDGAFGLEGLDPRSNPLPGGLSGLLKTAAREWPGVHCKAMDAARDWRVPDLAALLAREILTKGPLELGLKPGGSYGLELKPMTLTAPSSAAPLKPGEVILLTGGARGVTAEAAVQLAKAFQPTIVLIGRTPAPQAEPDWLSPLSTESAIKKALFSQAGGQLAPKAIEERYRRCQANREILRTLSRIESAGAKALYLSADVRNEGEVRAAVEEVRRSLGPIRGLVHGAGVLADRLIEDKTLDQFDAVFDTKVRGLRHLLKALPGEELKCLALFSSVTGRLGRHGQSDYALANEALNKAAQSLSRRHPACRVVSINWGPWDGGMVTPSLKKIFQDEGTPVIPLEPGALQLVREMAEPPGGPVEVLVLGKTAGPAAPVAVPETPRGALATAFERELDLSSHPILASHVINGRPVLPLALILEWLAHGAIHENPGLVFHGLDGLRVLKGVVLKGERPVHLRVSSGKAVKEGELFRAAAELESAEGLHARAQILLASRLPKPEGEPLSLSLPPYPRNLEEAYSDILFHGPELRGLQAVQGCGAEGWTALVKTAPPPIAWLREPLRSSWLADPLALDSVFQAAILWSVETSGSACLPCHLARYRQYQGEFPKTGLRVVARARKKGEALILADADFVDSQGRLVARLEGSEHALDASLNQAFRKRSLAA